MKLTFSALFLMCILAFVVVAPLGAETLNVTNFAAWGDAEQVWVSTAKGSSQVVFTNHLSNLDTNKTIEIFAVGNTNIGPGTLAYPAVTNCNQDYIGYITNVTTNIFSPGTIGGTNYLAQVWTPIGEVPQFTLTNAYCIYGTNNAYAFNACLGTGSTNATIYIPHGSISPWGTTNAYLMIPWQNYTNYTYSYYPYGDSNFPIVLNRGGFWFTGDGQGQTILMAQGAYKNQGGACIRSGIFSVSGGGGNLGFTLTNNYPLVWTNLTFDGGLQTGYVGNEGTQPANPIDGLGWDGTSCAGLDEDVEPTLNTKVFANCEFRHMRGEMIKGITGAAINETVLVTNCLFWDGNASCFNYNYAHTITGCLFSNTYMIVEFYLAHPTNAGSWFTGNTTTNIFHNIMSLNGGTLNNQPYVMSNNVLYCAMNGNAVATCPAGNATIVSNLFIEQSNAFTIAVSIGQAGPQAGVAGAFNTNIVVYGNTFSNQFYTYFSVGGGSLGDPNIASLVTISNNVAYGVTAGVLYLGGISTNVVLAGNNFMGANMQVQQTTPQAFGSPYAFINTNNNYWVQVFQDTGDGHTPITNAISYALGGKINLTYPWVPATLNYMTVTDASQVPFGAAVQFTNTTYILQSPSGHAVTVYLDGPNTNGPSITVQPAGSVTVFWNAALGQFQAATVQPPPAVGAPRGTGFASAEWQFGGGQ